MYHGEKYQQSNEQKYEKRDGDFSLDRFYSDYHREKLIKKKQLNRSGYESFYRAGKSTAI